VFSGFLWDGVAFPSLFVFLIFSAFRHGLQRQGFLCYALNRGFVADDAVFFGTARPSSKCKKGGDKPSRQSNDEMVVGCGGGGGGGGGGGDGGGDGVCFCFSLFPSFSPFFLFALSLRKKVCGGEERFSPKGCARGLGAGFFSY
jgi:hypothetical protein